MYYYLYYDIIVVRSSQCIYCSIYGSYKHGLCSFIFIITQYNALIDSEVVNI